ncbi:Protein saal1 [Senna tora]|uniref:Protein saal1 n=1 Tax=Senna tora TaxID=362788 RepID=A0A834TLZ8_9FABA|nr:Protein saal1 [Senna tora]
MAVRSDLAIEEEEEEEEEYGGPTHHPAAPLDESFDVSTTVDPSYIISLIRKLLPSGAGSKSSCDGIASDAPNQGSPTNTKEGNAVSTSRDKHFESPKKSSENMDVDNSGQFSYQQGELKDSCNGLEQSGASVGEEVWEEHGCILWDLASSKRHAELMVENLILEVLLANLMVCKSLRVTEICIGICGNLACHEVPMKRIVSTNGLIEIIVDILFLDDPQCLCETCRLLTVGLQSRESITWSKALQSEHILCQILWIVENTLNPQLMEKSIGLILAILESQQEVVDVLLPPMMKLGLASLLISLLASEMNKVTSERIPERYSILELILRAIEALSVIDDHSQEICSSKELFELVSGLVKFPDKFEVANCCVTAAVLIANILSDVADRASEISQDLSFLEGLLDIFPFASDDLEARNALWNIIARVLVRIRETEMSPSSLDRHVSVLVTKVDLIEDELLNQPLDDSRHGNERPDARITSLRRMISILNQWIAAKDNLNAEVTVNDSDVKKLLNCCNKYSK